VSSYHVRRLCEAGEIAAELSDGQQWRLSAAEIARLKKEGVPPVPHEIAGPKEDPPDDDDIPEGLYANPSDSVIEAAEEVKIVESRLRKRRLEREAEEIEDWFRDRQRQQAEEEAAQQERAEATRATQRRREWMQEWARHALDSLPYGVPRDTALEVHASVEQALRGCDAGQSDALTRRLVSAAVAKALWPWERRKEIERAIEAAMNRLPFNVRYGQECAALKQRAWEAAAAALGRVRAEAGYAEMESATIQAVQPVIREHEHAETCRRIVARIFLFGATMEEREEAIEAVRNALDALPVGTPERQLERTKETAMAPFEAQIRRRKEAAEREAAEQARRRDAERKADFDLGYIETYLQQEYDFDGGYFEMKREAERLRPVVRGALIAELLENPEMTPDEIRGSIADHVEDEQ
jgi:hypothetical protein